MAPRDVGASPASRVPRVLVVDDEPPIVELVAGYLAREGWEVRTTFDGIASVAEVRAFQPDAVVLDLMLPGLDGIEVCQQVRTFSDAYILMLTARAEEIDRVVGLTVGADDYLTKPFSPRELVARVKARLRRPRVSLAGAPFAPAPATMGLAVDAARRSVRVDGRGVELTATEFDVLAALAREPGVVLTRARLFQAVWGGDNFADDHVVDVHVGNIRRKLGDDAAAPRFIDTVRGVGYRLREPT